MYGATRSASVTAHQAAVSTTTSAMGRHRADAVRRGENDGRHVRLVPDEAGGGAGEEGRKPADAVTAMECPNGRGGSGDHPNGNALSEASPTLT